MVCKRKSISLSANRVLFGPSKKRKVMTAFIFLLRKKEDQLKEGREQVKDYERGKTKKEEDRVQERRKTEMFHRPTQVAPTDEMRHNDWRAGGLQLATSKSKFGLNELNTL